MGESTPCSHEGFLQKADRTQGSLVNSTHSPVYLEFYVHRSEASIQAQVYSTYHAIDNHSVVLSNH